MFAKYTHENFYKAILPFDFQKMEIFFVLKKWALKTWQVYARMGTYWVCFNKHEYGTDGQNALLGIYCMYTN